MSTIPSRSERLLLVVLLLGATSGSAAAAPDKATMALAQGHFRLGTAHYGAAAWDQAIREYETAYRLLPLPGFLFNLGQAHRMRGDRATAVDYYRRYLDAEPKGRVADEAKSHIVSLTRELGEAAAPVATTPAVAPAQPPPVTTAAAVAPPLPLAPAPAAPAPSPSPTVATIPAGVAGPPPPAATPVYRRGWFWGVMGGVVVAAGVGAGLGIGLSQGLRAETTEGTFKPF